MSRQLLCGGDNTIMVFGAIWIKFRLFSIVLLHIKHVYMILIFRMALNTRSLAVENNPENLANYFNCN